VTEENIEVVKYGTWEFSVHRDDDPREDPWEIKEPVGNDMMVLLTAQEMAALPRGEWTKIRVVVRPGSMVKSRNCPQCSGLRKLAEKTLGQCQIMCARCGFFGTPGWIPLETAETKERSRCAVNPVTELKPEDTPNYDPSEGVDDDLGMEYKLSGVSPSPKFSR